IAGLALAGSLLAVVACSNEPPFGTLKDEAMAVGRTAESLAGVKGDDEKDYLADMDYGYRRASDPSVTLNAAEVRGRVNWIVWTGGNDRFWDRMANHSYGAFDLVKIL